MQMCFLWVAQYKINKNKQMQKPTWSRILKSTDVQANSQLPASAIRRFGHIHLHSSWTRLLQLCSFYPVKMGPEQPHAPYWSLRSVIYTHMTPSFSYSGEPFHFLTSDRFRMGNTYIPVADSF